MDEVVPEVGDVDDDLAEELATELSGQPSPAASR